MAGTRGAHGQEVGPVPQGKGGAAGAERHPLTGNIPQGGGVSQAWTWITGTGRCFSSRQLWSSRQM